MVIFGHLVFYLFGHLVNNSAVRFSIYSAVWIRPYVEVRFQTEDNNLGALVVVVHFEPIRYKNSALWLNSTFQFFNNSALWLKIWPSGFLTIWPSGFGLTVQFDN